ncbi:MAG: hypothetical protein K8I29_00205 [Alphaproteobacteria bacterium]|uniref:Uncharacterized protein n=1 Tax=Candidatus Nitrobium versatile TaxID=2884831 RepID=A0A953M030_9BACT|nr:hypothetical protein [Candidatus Nitrobium versatile]
MNDHKKSLPATLKKYRAFGGLGAAIGGMIGGYISVLKGNAIYAGIGGGLGSIVGIMISVILGRNINNTKMLKTNGNVMYIVWGLASFLLAFGGVVGFILTKEWVLLIGAIFFGVCGIIYFLTKGRIKRIKRDGSI